MQYRLLMFFCLLLNIAYSQELLSPDALITLEIYDSEYRSLPGTPARVVAGQLAGLSLADMLAQGYIRRDDMRGFALPLGVHTNDKAPDFGRGMLHMWLRKAEYLRQHYAYAYPEELPDMMHKALRFAEQAAEGESQSISIRDYRDELLTAALARLESRHRDMMQLYSPERAEFMDMIMDNLTPNVLLGYNIQELIPSNHFIPNQKVRKAINPVFKAYYFDRLLQEAGLEFVEGIPAMYDARFSHGPFQLTDYALKDIYDNSRLVDEFKRYPSVAALDGIEQHLTAAAFVAYCNWERMSKSLENLGQLKTFNEYFRNYRRKAAKQRSLRILIAGITACMHHAPAPTRRLLGEYLSEHEDLSDIPHQVIPAENERLYNYYNSAAQSYLLMKVYHELGL